MISILILTRDEECNLSDCLDSVAWSDDVLVLDSGSTDRTVEIARDLGARVMHRPFDTFAAQRNFGLRRGGLRHRWVLHLDADERVTPELHEEMIEAARAGRHDAFRVALKLMFEGRWLRRAGMYPSYQVRFGRRDALTFQEVGHGQRETLPPERVGQLSNPLEHYAFSKGLTDWLAKHNRYSSAEARLAWKLTRTGVDWRGLLAPEPIERWRALKALSYRLPLRPFWRFFYLYVVRGGFLEGSAGFHYSRLLALFDSMTAHKLRRLRREGLDLPS